MRLLIATVVLSALTLNAQSHVREATLTLPTYDEGAPDPNPQFPAFSKGYFPNYPYAIRTPGNKTPRTVPWRALVVENEYLSCRILPDLGGHLYGCLDKVTGREIFYANPTVRRDPESTRGAFVAMGIESSFPLAHSRVSSSPVDFAISEAGGIGRIIVEDTDRVSGMTWRDEFILRPRSAVLEQHVTLHNPTEARRGFQWWANAAVEVDDPGLRFIYPVNWMLPHGPNGMTPWPIDQKGVDLSVLANHKAAIGLFAHGSHEPWMAVYKPKFRSGIVHFANPEGAEGVIGKKLWLWGPEDSYVKENLTANFNSYVEMQAGLMETQPEFGFLFPGESRTFTHYWIPVRDMSGISRASLDAVAFLTRSSVEITATHQIPHAKIVVSDGPKTLLEVTTDLDPKTKFTRTLTGSSNLITLQVVDATGHHLLDYTEGIYDSLPFNAKGEVPDPQPPPAGAISEKDVIARGSFNEQRDQFAFAWSDYKTGLAKYPASAAIALGAGRTAFVLHRFDDAIRLLAPLTLPEARWYHAAALAATGHTAEAKAAWYRAALDVACKDSAAFRIAWLDAAPNRLPEAMAPDSPALEIAILRRAGKPDAAKPKLDQDPADNLLRAERLLLGLGEDPSFWRHLAGDPERVLTLADAYFSLGAFDDALRFLDHQYPAVPPSEAEPGAVLPQNHPLVAYYRGYARSKLGQDPAPDFKLAASLPILYIFPTRASSVPVLQAALAKNDSDANAHALLGDLAMASLEIDQAILQWRKALSLNPALPGIQPSLDKAMTGRPGEPEPTAAPKPAERKTIVEPPPSDDLAGKALIQSVTDPEAAAKVFTNANFPKEKQPEEVRRAYMEVELQRLAHAAYTGFCADALPRLDTLGDENKNLTFTMYGFGNQIKAAHFQYYLGVIESTCGDDKAARKRWVKISRANEPANSIEFVFPLLAAHSAGEADWQKRADAAMQNLKGDSPATKFARGALLAATGKRDEADALLLEASRSADLMIRYLSLVTLRLNAKAAR